MKKQTSDPKMRTPETERNEKDYQVASMALSTQA